jgi:DNA-directed RNA polymerase
LLLTVLAGVREGITQFALVHDSFGCLPSQAARFQGIIRETFVEMYETHDVLAEVLQRATCDLIEHDSSRLPSAIEYGNLNIKEVLNAKYAFA